MKIMYVKIFIDGKDPGTFHAPMKIFPKEIKQLRNSDTYPESFKLVTGKEIITWPIYLDIGKPNKVVRLVMGSYTLPNNEIYFMVRHRLI